ncbi:MAG: aminoacyl-histidine dipeptidase [Gammaproteobacteria bacterium]|nr:MAG: aminoacyl-histidine dipeptidase [Gammaproteobacteria bacterium]RKZ45087.1 MAG: aminoacyl-histidine dipeptidase [Gammaproteobacteria bacterium]RKZ76277.1 MAG: aminoacyl-histidine dipeptidase [Gammaproteobacteria bacterium]
MTYQHEKTHEILKWFEKMNQIPRCSGNEEAIRTWLINWSNEHHFAIKTDKVGNLLISVPASSGYENAPIVVIQGHLDMVCEKTHDSKHDFTKDPIKLIEDGEWLRADNTSLGADNGIAIAIAMTLSLDKSISHPPLELLFTIDEERGLVGAGALEPGFFEGRILINLDSEDEGYFMIGCAGGLNTLLSIPLEWTDVPNHYQVMKIQAGGMKGGHSGIDINAQRANAIKVLAQILLMTKSQVDLRLVKFNGGTANNAIPRDAEAFVLVPEEQAQTVKKLALEAAKNIRAEFQNTDPDLFIKVDTVSETFTQTITAIDTQKLIDVIMVLPHGVIAMSTDMKELVETSNNIAKISIENGQLKVLNTQRSSVESRTYAVSQRIEAVARLVGGEVSRDTYYPGWQPNMASPLLAKSIDVYKKQFGKKPQVTAIHAGLECGIIGSQVSGMDMLSTGATIKDPHSPDEKIHIGSIGKVWDFMVALLV